MKAAETVPQLVAIDLDGTTINEFEQASDHVRKQLQRVSDAGHHVVITTGRSPGSTVSILEHLQLWPEYVIASNGAVLLRKTGAGDYRPIRTAVFDPSSVLAVLRENFPSAAFAVEDGDGVYRFTKPFPPQTTELAERQQIVAFEELHAGAAVRVIAIDPAADIDQFRTTVQALKLGEVSFALGWSAWLDIAASSTTKATAAEYVRELLDVPRDRVVAVGDGFNDVQLLEWAAERGRGVAMGNAPDLLLAVASETTGTVAEDGLAAVLASVLNAPSSSGR